jgi:hypothetical protein
MGITSYCVVSGFFFALVALAHLLRLIFGMSIQVDDFEVPMFVSGVAFVISTGLALWAFRTGRRLDSPKI